MEKIEWLPGSVNKFQIYLTIHKFELDFWITLKLLDWSVQFNLLYQYAHDRWQSPILTTAYWLKGDSYRECQFNG